MTVRLICGPPGAGKSTLAREKAGDGDLVIDLDEIRASVGNDETARKVRDLMESGARDHDGDVWIIRTLAKADERAEFAERIGVDEVTVLAVDAETAKERVRQRDGSDDKIPAIDRWWENYTPDTEASAMDKQNENAQQEAPEATTKGEAQREMKADLNAAGVPADVPVAEMSVEHQAAYWKARARANEKEAREYREAVERVEAERKPDPAPATPDPAQREVFEARVDAALATRPDYAGVPFSKHLDMSTFVGNDGRVDREAVGAFFEALPQGSAVKTAGSPTGWGSNAPYQGASGVDAGREMFMAERGKN